MGEPLPKRSTSSSSTIPAPEESRTGRIKGVATWLLGHWLLVFNLALAVYLGGATASPLLMAVGQEEVGIALFSLYGTVCHQYPWRAFFLLGHPVAFCQRDVAMYSTMLLGGLGYGLRRGQVHPLPWLAYLLAVLPVALDGGTQLLGWRESTWELRTATGALFGLATVWAVYPLIDRSIGEAGSQG